MKIETAANRLYWRFGNKKSFTPDQTDLEALNSLVDWINGQQKIVLRDQQLFAKLYIHSLKELMLRYGNLENGKHELDTILGLSLAYQVDDFSFKFNIVHYLAYCKMKKIPVADEKEFYSKEGQELIKYHIENDKNFIKEMLGWWSKEKIETSLVKDISEAIEKYKELI